MACLAAFGFISVLSLIALAIIRQRGTPMEPYNSAVQSLGAPPYEDGDFLEIPTTGSVQEFERDARPEQIIGSSGFEGRQYREDDEV